MQQVIVSYAHGRTLSANAAVNLVFLRGGWRTWRHVRAGTRDPARAYYPPAAVDVRAIRRRQKLTQTAFARRYGFTIGAVRDWEQELYPPDQTARAYLLVIDRKPEAVERALHAA